MPQHSPLHSFLTFRGAVGEAGRGWADGLLAVLCLSCVDVCVLITNELTVYAGVSFFFFFPRIIFTLLPLFRF